MQVRHLIIIVLGYEMLIRADGANRSVGMGCGEKLKVWSNRGTVSMAYRHKKGKQR